MRTKTTKNTPITYTSLAQRTLMEYVQQKCKAVAIEPVNICINAESWFYEDSTKPRDRLIVTIIAAGNLIFQIYPATLADAYTQVEAEFTKLATKEKVKHLQGDFSKNFPEIAAWQESIEAKLIEGGKLPAKRDSLLKLKEHFNLPEAGTFI